MFCINAIGGVGVCSVLYNHKTKTRQSSPPDARSILALFVIQLYSGFSATVKRRYAELSKTGIFHCRRRMYVSVYN
ncbi:hypothetical protein AMTR_s00119p00021490 [Amborella trichopoda]|uniref:Uncharacterized protein n=1 Tax=Amborella trichopoda TaxID=13333 RepID=W1NNA5_AMBTC|nr:hypothetical protein AMTR_s00119p00021490 [Amborella trichopoda]